MNIALICFFAGVCAGIPFTYYFSTIGEAEQFARTWNAVQYTIEGA